MPFAAVVLAFLCGLLTSCSHLEDRHPIQLAVFAQGSPTDLPKSIFTRDLGGKKVTFRTIPEFTENNIVAFHPFPAEDGSQGICVQLDFNGRNALETVTRLNQGSLMLSMINGQFVDFVAVDETITNGLFTVWGGIPQELVELMDKKYPRIQTLREKGANSSSSSMDMVPSTRSEKREAYRKSQKLKPASDKKGETAPLSEALKLN